MLALWDDLLQRFEATCTALQSEQMTPIVCSNLYGSLIDYVSKTRDRFDEFENQAKQILPDTDYRATKKRLAIHRKRADDSTTPEVVLHPRDDVSR